jgi:hypothetical protein
MTYRLIAVRTFENIVPESKIVFRTIHGEAVSESTLPERRWTTREGYVYKARNKADRDHLLATGNWMVADA